jgi:hypothetical protein
MDSEISFRFKYNEIDYLILSNIYILYVYIGIEINIKKFDKVLL